MACSSTRVLPVFYAVMVGFLMPGCSEFSGAGDTEDGSSSSGTPNDSSSTSSTSTPSTSSSTTDDTTTSSTGTSTSSPTSASSSSSETTSGESGSDESGQRCDEGELCGDECVNTETDVAHCGGCEAPCSTENATPSCAKGECILSCADGFDNCDTDLATGCEQALETPDHCGACDVAGIPEICDGLDNDCAVGLLADEGCPDGVSLTDGGFGAHALFGNATGGDPFEDVCPAGASLVGFSGNVGGNIDRIRGVCAVMSLDVDTAVTPYTYSITTGATTDLPTHGSNVTTPFAIQCPADTFVVGISGEASGDGLHDVTIHCAALLVAGTPGTFAVSYGPITTQTVDGSNAGTDYSDLLAEPAVADRYRGRSGSWNDAIGIGEATVTLDVAE